LYHLQTAERNIYVKEHDRHAEVKIFVLTSVGIMQTLTVTQAQVIA